MSIRKYIKSVLLDIYRTIQALSLKYRYRRNIARLRTVYGTRKIIVAFGVSEVAKWKSQSLYDNLRVTDIYSPIIYVYPSPLESNMKSHEIETSLQSKVSFFKMKNMDVINIWDNVSNKCVIPHNLQPDIIFYQQPWDIPPFPSPLETSKYALSFYIPYYLVNNFNIEVEFGLPLHYQVFGYIVQNEQAVKLFTSMLTKRHYAGQCLGLGHTIVDYLTADISSTKKNSVIYAPHFSFPVEGIDRVLTYSTFLENGRLILDFAKQHPEFEWVFKPHPRLKIELENTGVWSTAEIDDYFEAWNKIGTISMTSDYAVHFQNSFAMITDCGSFLTEYSCMDKPLIRLYYYKDNLPPNPILKNLYKTFYYANNNSELITLLENIIVKRLDPNKSQRNSEVSKLGLNKSNSSLKIIDYLDSLLS